MRWCVALACALALLLPRLASAQPFTVTAPDGWERYPELTSNVIEVLARGDPMRGASHGAQAHASPGKGAFYVVWIEGAAPPGDSTPEALVRSAFDRIRAAPGDGAASGEIEELAHRESRAGGAAELRLETRHVANETVTLVRALAWADSGRQVHLVKAECVVAAADLQAMRPICDRALASLEVRAAEGSEVGALGAVGEPGAGSPAETAGLADRAGDEGGGDAADRDRLAGKPAPTLETPQLRPPDPAARGNVVYEAPPRKQENRGRWLVLAGGVLLVVAFYLTTRRRGEIAEDADDDEDAEGGEDEPEERPEAKADGAGEPAPGEEDEDQER